MAAVNGAVNGGSSGVPSAKYGSHEDQEVSTILYICPEPRICRKSTSISCASKHNRLLTLLELAVCED